MDARKLVRALRIFLETLRRMKGLTVYSTSLEDEIKVLEVMEKYNLDFDDALQAYVASIFGATVVSFDDDFDKLDFIERKTPADVLKS